MTQPAATNIPCLPDDRLRGLLAGDDDSAAEHLAACESCRARFDRLAAGDTGWLLAITPTAHPPAPLLDSLHALGTTDLPARETVAQLDTLEELFPGLPTTDGQRPQIGPYELHAIVGRGGMGIVVQGYDVRLQRTVALKIPAPHLRHEPVARGRFVREGRAAALIAHPNAMPVFAVEEFAGVPVLVMPYVVGESLQQRLDRDGKLAPQFAVEVALQVALALEAAHAVGIVHRDVKPANVLLDAGTDHVRLTDFGLARAADDARLTQTGVGAGTPTFMAPEQARGEAVDHRADLFSLGSLLFTMLAGTPPFPATTLMGTLRRIADGPPDSLRTLVPNLPRHIEEIVMDLLKTDPSRRPPTATAVVARLRQSTQYLADGIDATRSSRRRWATAALLIVGLGLTALAAGTVYKFPTPEGTLIVEVMDDDTTVTFDRDGKEVTITTKDGKKEFKLKVGTHKVTKTTPDGASEQFVEITRDGKPVVTARYEPKAAAGTPLVLLDPNTGRPYRLQDIPAPPLGDQLNPPPVGIEFTTRNGGKMTAAAAAAMGLKPPGFRLKEVRTYTGHTGPVRGIAITPDGKKLVTSTSWPASDETVRVWDTETGKLLHTLRGHKGDMSSVVVAADGKRAVSMASDGWIIVWDIVAGKELNRTETPGKTPGVAVALDPTNRLLAAGLADRTVRVYEFESMKLQHTLTGHTGRVLTVAFSPVGSVLLSGSEDETVRAWDAVAGKMMWMNSLGRQWVHQVGFDSTGEGWLAVDKVLVRGHTGTGKILSNQRLGANMDALTGVVASPTGGALAVTAYNGSVAVVPTDPNLAPTYRAVLQGSIHCTTFSPDGKRLFVGGGGNYDLATKRYTASDECIREYTVEPLPREPKR